MAKVKDWKIESTLRTVVRDAINNGEEVTVNPIRARTEKKLGLEDSYLKGDEWKLKSKAIIQAAFLEPGKDEEQRPAEKVKKGAPKPQKESKQSKQPVTSAAASQAKDPGSIPKPPQQTAPKVNGVKRKASESESASGSGAEYSESFNNRVSEGLPNKKYKLDVPDSSKHPSKAKSAASSTSSEESPAEGSESEESDTSGSNGEEANTTPSPTQPTVAECEDAIRPIPSKAFRPPSGYTAIDSNLLATNGTMSEANLQGKQIWHITAPSKVPLSSLTELALSSISSGEPVVTHNNISYILGEDKASSAESTTLLAPLKDGYKKLQPKVTRTLHLQQKIDLPNLSSLQASQVTGSNAAGDVAQAPVSTVRPQPKGLRMRYKPPGFGKGRPGKIGSGSESGGEDEESGPTFQFPKTLGQHGIEVKQTGDLEMLDAAEIEGDSKTDTEIGKKAKKKRKEKDGGQPKVNGVEKTKPVVEEASTAELDTHDNALPNGRGDARKSREEKRRRKEEKRARKDAKSKAREAAV